MPDPSVVAGQIVTAGLSAAGGVLAAYFTLRRAKVETDASTRKAGLENEGIAQGALKDLVENMVAKLRTDMDDVRAHLEEAERQLGETRRQLVDAERRLAVTERELERERERADRWERLYEHLITGRELAGKEAGT